jgi:4-oxalocrotonate tautomerase
MQPETSGVSMPYVNVKLTSGVSREAKQEIVREITLLLQRVLNKKPEHTHIVIDEVETDNWGFAGQLTTDWLEQRRREER